MEEMALWLRALAAPAENPVWFLLSTWQLVTICDDNSRKDIQCPLLPPPRALDIHVVHMYM